MGALTKAKLHHGVWVQIFHKEGCLDHAQSLELHLPKAQDMVENLGGGARFFTGWHGMLMLPLTHQPLIEVSAQTPILAPSLAQMVQGLPTPDRPKSRHDMVKQWGFLDIMELPDDCDLWVLPNGIAALRPVPTDRSMEHFSKEERRSYLLQGLWKIRPV